MLDLGISNSMDQVSVYKRLDTFLEGITEGKANMIFLVDD